MKNLIKKCDIFDLEHSGEVNTKILTIIFDHDQQDGQSNVKPYFESIEIEICESCYKYMMENRRYIYGFGAMGYNKYFLKLKNE